MSSPCVLAFLRGRNLRAHREVPSQGSIGMRPLAALIQGATGMGAVGYDGLQEAIQRAAVPGGTERVDGSCPDHSG